MACDLDLFCSCSPFESFRKLKDMQHKYYELNRADKEKPELFLIPVFQAKKASSGNEVKVRPASIVLAPTV